MRSIKTINNIITIHFLLLFFQLALRYFIDTSMLRDVCIFILLIFYGNHLSFPKNNRFSSLIKILMTWGVVVLSFHISTYSSAIDSILEYRNFFFPFIIFPFVTIIFKYKIYRVKWTNIIYFFYIFLLVDIYIEYIFQLNGISRDIFPWYPYQYTHLYRFNTSPDAIANAISPQDAPILGLMGYPNSTAPSLMALFAVNIPYLLSKHKFAGVKVSQHDTITKYLLIILTIGALFILQTKTLILALVIVFFVYALISGKRLFTRFIILFGLLFVAAMATKGMWYEDVSYLIEETQGVYGFTYIFDLKPILFALQNLFSSPLTILFGSDITSTEMFQYLEIRLLTFTLQLGIIWLIITLLIIFKALKYLRKIKGFSLNNYFMIVGCALSVLVFFVDFMHYANVMYLFNINFFVLILALMSANFDDNMTLPINNGMPLNKII